MLLAEVVAASRAVAATTSRRVKIEILADCLRRAELDDLGPVTAWLAGSPRQRRTGIGWAAVRDLPPPAPTAELTVAELEHALHRAATLSGPGSDGGRRALLLSVLTRATVAEQDFLRGLLAGGLRQGAQTALVVDAVASSAGAPADAVRAAVALCGDPGAVAEALRRDGPTATAAFRLQLGRPVSPMLAQSANDVPAALDRTGAAALEWKLDGVRVQIHRDGAEVAVFTRTLDDVTSRLPDVVRTALSLPVRRVVLDGEAIALRPDGRPLPFQVTSAQAARRTAGGVELSTRLFDVLHAEGEDLLTAPDAVRHATLAGLAPPGLLVPRWTPPQGQQGDRAEAVAFARAALAAGHEGVVTKALDAPYTPGRRSPAWIKVKPRITLDLVVLAVERGHGRRRGWLSNLHLGARDPEGRFGPPGGFVMLGKTFKGLTDAMLTWQTERLHQLAAADDGHTVTTRPELVVEIAFDGVQVSRRYPAGVALRFARVLAHRPDKPAGQADTVEAVLAHAPTEMGGAELDSAP